MGDRATERRSDRSRDENSSRRIVNIPKLLYVCGCMRTLLAGGDFPLAALASDLGRYRFGLREVM